MTSLYYKNKIRNKKKINFIKISAKPMRESRELKQPVEIINHTY